MQIHPIIILAHTTTLLFWDRIVAMSSNSVIASLSLCFLSLFFLSAFARPATFLQDFHVTWSDSHIRQIDGGRAIQLVLDQNSGKKPFNYYIFWHGKLYYLLFTNNINNFDYWIWYNISGCGFASKNKYLFGRVSMKIKLIPGDSAGTVTAFYVSTSQTWLKSQTKFWIFLVFIFFVVD